MRGKQQTRKLILDTAAELLQRNGFGGFSYQHIAARLGVRNAAIHYHFPGKGDLGVALIRRYRANFTWWTDQLASQAFSPAGRLEAFFELERRYLQEGKVCPLGVVGVEFALIPDPMRRETEVFVGELLQWLTALLEEGRQREAFTFSGSARGKALSVLTSLQGALQLARIGGPSVFQQAVDQVRDELEVVDEGIRRHVPAAG